MISEIDRLTNRVMGKITEAAQKQDLPTLEKMTAMAAELNALKGQFVSIERRLGGIQQQLDEKQANFSPPKGALRELRIEVTGGMLRQNLLTLTEHVKAGRIKIGEDLIVQSRPSGEKFKTSLLENSNKLQERGAIKRFYQEAHVHEGDMVTLWESTPGNWELRKAS